MSLLGRVRDSIFGHPPPITQFSGSYPFFNVLEVLIRDLTDIEDVEFLQIGAADGLAEDPIADLVRHYGWHGTLVEPSPGNFRKLKQNYQGYPALRFEQVIVTDRPGCSEEVLYEIREDFREDCAWAEQSSSMSRDVVMGALHYLSTTEAGRVFPNDLNSAVGEVRLPAVHIADLVRDVAPERLDLLVIDTMGYDGRLLMAFPFAEVRPTVIMFEHSLLDTAEKQQVLRYLATQGYSFVKYAVDTIAVHSGRTRQWSVSEW